MMVEHQHLCPTAGDIPPASARGLPTYILPTYIPRHERHEESDYLRRKANDLRFFPMFYTTYTQYTRGGGLGLTGWLGVGGQVWGEGWRGDGGMGGLLSLPYHFPKSHWADDEGEGRGEGRVGGGFGDFSASFPYPFLVSLLDAFGISVFASQVFRLSGYICWSSWGVVV